MSHNAMNKPSRTDWDYLARVDDEDIDQSDIPALTNTFFERAQVYLPRHMAENMIQLDEDIVAWFKAHGEEYTTMINAVLRSYIETQEK